MKKVIKIENLNFGYDKNLVLENIDLDVFESDFLGIIGPNGSGKTTLIKLMLGILSPTSGKISILDENPKKAQEKISYVPQFGQMEKSFPIKAKSVVEMGLCGKKSFLPWTKKEDIVKIEKAMKHVDILDLAEKPFGELSGGQQQRCLIARAIVSEPKILLLDEPTASVDSSVEEDIFKLLKKLNNEITIILISHDIGFISSYVNRIACVNKNLVCHNVDDMKIDNIMKDSYSNEVSIIHHKCGL
ncbi:MAG: ABC transporter ATP-binding protein [Melioribacteraceae bacterium]|nr:ABC transporter ATP-binding protein [Melioribacteraceae bacterium]